MKTLQERGNEFEESHLLEIKSQGKTVSEIPKETYPKTVSHCDICKWWKNCNAVRRKDDHLSFVAGMGASQMKEFKLNGIDTLEN